MTTLEVRDLRKEFRLRGRKRLVAVDGVSFTLDSRRTVALVGESGSGKTTVARILARLTKPSSGEILLDGSPVGRSRSATRDYRSAVQMVFQDPFGSLNPSHTIGYHLRRPLAIHAGDEPTSPPDGAVRELLTRVNLGPAEVIAARYPHELSGGQRQRVAIARAIAPRPSVLLADEPVSMLDVSIRLEILELLDQLKSSSDLAMLYITHDLATARYFSTSILVMYRGEIVESGSADDVIVRSAHPYTQLLARSAPDPAAGRRTPTPTAATRSRPDFPPVRQDGSDPGCRFRDRCEFAMPTCVQRPPVVEVRPGHHSRCWLPVTEQRGD